VNLVHALLRDVAPTGDEQLDCKKTMGDGLDVESYPGERASEVNVDRTRIEGAKRAGVFAGDGDVTLSESIVLACDDAIVDVTFDRASRPVGALCGCGTKWAPCAFASVAMDSWAVSGKSSAWPDRSSVVTTCAFDELIPDPTLANVSLWSLFAPETVPLAIAPRCADLLGMSTGWSSITVSKPGFFSHTAPVYFDAPREAQLVGFGTLPLSTAYGALWPVGAPLASIVGAPNGSSVALGQMETLVSITGALIPDGTLPGPSGGYAEELLYFPEGGWHSVSITTPSVYTCSAYGPGSPTTPTTFVAHVIPGTVSDVQFNCSITDPNAVLNHTDEPIARGRNAAEEGPLGDLVADCMRSTMKTEFAVINSAALSQDLPAGDITWSTVLATLAFSNDKVAFVRLTGQQLIDFLNEQWFTPPGSIVVQHRPLEISGLQYTWDASLPAGSRVQVNAVFDSQGNPIQLGTTYDVAIPDYLVTSGSAFPTLQGVVPTAVGESEAEVFGKCIASLPRPLSAPTDVRVTRLH